MSGDMMSFPNNWWTFVQQYQFADKEEIYTNGSMLIPSFRVRQMVEHYFDVNPDGLPVGLTISKDGNLLDWRGENYVRQSTLGSDDYKQAADYWKRMYEKSFAALGSGTCKNTAPSYLDFLCSKCGFVHYHSDENDTGDGNDWNYCPNCGKAVKR